MQGCAKVRSRRFQKNMCTNFLLLKSILQPGAHDDASLLMHGRCRLHLSLSLSLSLSFFLYSHPFSALAEVMSALRVHGPTETNLCTEALAAITTLSVHADSRARLRSAGCCEGTCTYLASRDSLPPTCLFLGLCLTLLISLAYSQSVPLSLARARALSFSSCI